LYIRHLKLNGLHVKKDCTKRASDDHDWTLERADNLKKSCQTRLELVIGELSLENTRFKRVKLAYGEFHQFQNAKKRIWYQKPQFQVP